MPRFAASLRRFAYASLAVLAFSVPVALDARADEERNAHLSQDARIDLDRLSKHLGSLTTLQGDFVQLTQNGGMATGKFYMRKPGRLRFEYAPPTPVVLVADGTLVSIDDRELETVNSYPLNTTPLKMLLDTDVNLIKDADIEYVTRRPGEIIVKAVKDDGLAQGELTMVFSALTMELTKWTVLDAQGSETTVILQNIQYGMPLSAALFVPRDYDFEDVRD